MSTSPIPFAERANLSAEQWNRLLSQALCELRVACPAVVESFDAEKQVVSIRLLLRENIVEDFKVVQKEIVIPNVPIVFPRAGGFTLTLPIQAGDECLAVFADMCLDAWWQSGGVQNQLERRRHDLTDAIAIFGVWSQQRLLQNYSTNSGQLRNDDGTVSVDIKDSQITVTAPKVVVTGSNEVDISGNGVTKIEGIDFLTHQHTGVATGGGVSGPVKNG